ncbi:hemicentin-1-like [Nymphalis io]|uniref:hemicentin-1-like n=1 Tax=Inachis io TaxID=171585 RepID=UPI0021671611|nr:hemicentin-1-like [Nymphalis io]
MNCHQLKSSLVFVIDRTSSMQKVINEVKNKTDLIFDAVLKSNNSRIDDFILVTFDDPKTEVKAWTSSREEFKAALKDIKLVNGCDCPEYSMSGIEEALQISKPNSFFYVFTDASAKDYLKIDVVKSLSQKKAIQVNFLLTGICNNYGGKYFSGYENLTVATSGQIFHIKKNDITKIIKYIVESIKNKRTILNQQYIKQKGGTVQFTVDSKIQDVLISISSNSPSYRVTDSIGNIIESTEIVHTEKTAVDKIIAKPGNYTIHINNDIKCSVVVSGSTTVCFEYGFSIIEPTTINETSTKPLSDLTEKQYLSIVLDNNEKDIKLETAEIRDIDYSILKVLPLKIINVEQQFYVTEPFKPPFGMFKISINGITNTKEKITRISTSTSEYQDRLEKAKFTVPEVTILSKSPVDVEFDNSLTLKCKVHAFPEPKITWTDSSGAIISSKLVLPIDLPYDYISVLELNKVNTNMTLTCTAINDKGDRDAKVIDVKTKKKMYLKIIEYPKDTTVEYKTSVEFKCIVDASPAETITWFKDNDKINSDENYDISPDGSKLTIKSMNTKLKGNYHVNITNGHETKDFPFKVAISGTDAPKIDKRTVIYYRKIGHSVDLPCRVIKGKPDPVISWSFSKDDSLLGFEALESTKSILHIDDIGEQHNGIYKCKATNDINEDFHEMQLIVEYRPSVKMIRRISFNQSEPVILNCIVDGSPQPTVQWTYNETEIKVSSKYRIFRNNSLSFIGSIRDSGKYYCKARNSLGEVKKYTFLTIYEPVSIEPPTELRWKLQVGSSITLDCIVHGYPKPTVKWIMHFFEPNILPLELPHNKNNSYKLNRAQINEQGNYSCVAENAGGVKVITYEIFVLAAPKIIKTSKTTTLNAVVGDLALRVPCKAEGSPKPTITWEFNNLNIAKDTAMYDIDEDGTLIIKNISLSAEGSYVCKAENSLNFDRIEYDVKINSFVDTSFSITIKIELGSSTEISCGNYPGLVIQVGNSVRWFKDGVFFKEGRLILSNAQLSDSGVYTCRLSTFWSSDSYAKKVVVGFKPEFTSNFRKNIKYNEGITETLDCSAKGEPAPTVRWRINSKSLKEKSMLYKFTMEKTNIGVYKCVITNDFGSIVRQFQIKSEACTLPRKNYIDKHMPLIVSKSQEWIYERTISFYTQIYIICPGSFLSNNKERLGTYISATCIDKTLFQINNKTYDISALKCDKEIKVKQERTYKPCRMGNTELIMIGYSLSSTDLLRIFDVCIDKDKFKIHFTKYGIGQGIANTDIIGAIFEESELLPLNFDDIYDCKEQINSISITIGRSFSKSDKCCFGKRQLVNSKDVLPGLGQAATFTYLNVVPVWSSCSLENWDEVERRVRSLAMSLGYMLEIWTGSSHSIQLTSKGSTKEINLYDRNNYQQQVPLYIWKVVINYQEGTSLAIIFINVPNLTSQQALFFMNCKDICHETEWMRNPAWHDVKKGFVFCCKIRDFEKAFDYRKLFRVSGAVLKA